jgi:uncharacterized protein (DUF433 family)
MNGSGILQIRAELPPLQPGPDGAIRVGNSRITLDVIVEAFEQGLPLDEIASEYDVLERADVYSAIAFYLRHKSEVQAYLNQRRQFADDLEQHLQAAGLTPTQSEIDALKARWGTRKSPEC